MRKKQIQQVMFKVFLTVLFLKFAASSENSTVSFTTKAANSTQALPQATESIVQGPVSVSHTSVLSPSSTSTIFTLSSSIQSSGSNQVGIGNNNNNQNVNSNNNQNVNDNNQNQPTRVLTEKEKQLFEDVNSTFVSLNQQLNTHTRDNQPLTDEVADDLQRILKIKEFTKKIAKFAKDFEARSENSKIDLLQNSSQTVVAIKRIDCLASNGSRFPDKQDFKKFSVEWLRRSDSIYIPFDCPRIPKPIKSQPVYWRRRRDITIDIVLSHEDLQPHAGFHHLRYRRSANNSSNCTNGCAGGWSNYEPWSSCSKTCGQGTRSRTRSCTNPPPSNNGPNCTGDAVETEQCTLRECIVCGGQVPEEKENGFLTSPKYPSTYPSLARCEWTIYGGPNSSVVLELIDFHLEKDKKCFYDSLTVFDGNSTNSPQMGSRLCGRQSKRRYKSSGNIMVVLFKSDSSENYKGFNASWNKEVSVVTPPPPVEYVEQYTIVTSFIYNPFVNGTTYPLGKATTCNQGSRETPCIFDLDQYAIGRIIFSDINRQDQQFNSSSVVLTFEHIMNKDLFPKAYIGQKSCVTWNSTAKSLTSGGWTRRGGKVMETNITHTICEFDHLGIFTVLGELRETKAKFSLMENTYVGFGVSFLFLILAVAHIFLKGALHGGELMRVNMCASIIMMEIVFLVGAHVEAEQNLCGFLAFLIYFCVLAEFSWLLLHALRLQGKIKNLFTASVNIEIIYLVIGWGIPLLMAAIAGGVQTNVSDENLVCWKAAAGGGMWGYATPVILFGLMTAVISLMLLIPTARIKEQYEYDKMKFRVMKDIALLILFSLTCTMAYWAVFWARFREQYFLSVFVVLQSVAMFAFGREEIKDFVKSEEQTPKQPNTEEGDEKQEEEKAKEEEEEEEEGEREGEGDEKPKVPQRERKETEDIKEGKDECKKDGSKKKRRRRRRPQDLYPTRAHPSLGRKGNSTYA